mmetsp:Transcript_25161/g.57831  ORF Transcript_25161/g.57831 Transcript_25161/m.57831 type:complete len:922 (-) Transcript_25161:58-2823(-)
MPARYKNPPPAPPESSGGSQDTKSAETRCASSSGTSRSRPTQDDHGGNSPRRRSRSDDSPHSTPNGSENRTQELAATRIGRSTSFGDAAEDAVALTDLSGTEGSPIRLASRIKSQQWRAKVISNIKQPWQRPQQMPSWDSVRTVELKEREHLSSPARVETHQFSAFGRWWWEAQGWVLASVIGFLCFLTYVCIEVGIGGLSSLRFGRCEDGLFKPEPHCPLGRWTAWEKSGPTIGFMVSVSLGTAYAACSATLMQFAPAASGSGIPEVKTILNGFVLPDVLTFRTLIIKIPGLILSVASGMALGHEGPMIHIAVCWAQLLTKFFPQYKNEAKRRELFSAAMAAGVGVAFGSPVGGVLFSLEESSIFPSRTLLRSFIASVMATLLLTISNLTGTEKGITMFSVQWTDTPHPSEYIMFVLLGLTGGLVGAAFNFLNIRWNAIRKMKSYKAKVAPVPEVTLIAFITLCTSWYLPFTRYLNPETIHALFDNCVEPTSATGWTRRGQLQFELGVCTDAGRPAEATATFLVQLGLAAVIRFVQTAMTIGLGCPAGLFVPSLFIGACLGRCMGGTLKAMNTVHDLFSHDIDPGVYAMVGAAAVLAGVTRMTISLVVIMLELTDSLDYVVPFMLAVLVARTTGNALIEAIYDLQIIAKGYPYLHEEIHDSYNERCCDVMETGLIKIDASLFPRLVDLRVMLRAFTFQGFPVVDGARFLGYVRRKSLQQLILHLEHFREEDEEVSLDDLYPFIDSMVMRMVPDAPLSQVHQVFKQLGVSHIFIVGQVPEAQNSGNDNLLGILSKKSFLRFLRDGRVALVREDADLPAGRQGCIGPWRFAYSRALRASTAEHVCAQELAWAKNMSPRSIMLADQASRKQKYAGRPSTSTVAEEPSEADPLSPDFAVSEDPEFRLDAPAGGRCEARALYQTQ